MLLKEIAEHLNCRLTGSPEKEIRGVAGLEDAKPDELTFLSNPKYVRKVQASRAGAIIVGSESGDLPMPALVADEPYFTFARAVELFYQPPNPPPVIHPTASVDETAVLGEDCSLGPHVVVGAHARIGDRATLHSGVAIYPYAEIGDDFLAHSHSCVREYCRVGNRVILQNGAVIGSDGFGFAPRKDGSYHKIVQSGIVVLEDDVEIGANSCIDRATIGETRVEKGTKIDNLVQIGHGSRVGRHSVLAAQVGLAGSSQVGSHVMLAGQVGVAGHLTIGDKVIATAQTGIARDVEPGSRVSGSPEMDSALWKKNYLLLQRLPEMSREIRRLRKEIDELKATPGSES